MREKTAKRILKSGTIREKTRLLYESVALRNEFNMELPHISIESPEVQDSFLFKPLATQEEEEALKEEILSSNKTKYYNNLSEANKGFLVFRSIVSAIAKDFNFMKTELKKYVTTVLLQRSKAALVNDLLEEAKEAKEIQAKQAKRAAKELRDLNAEIKAGYIEIPERNLNKTIDVAVEQLNQHTEDAKFYIEHLTEFLNKELPMAAYRRFLKRETQVIKDNLQECKDLIAALGEEREIVNYEDVEIGINKDILKRIKKLGR